MAVKPKTVSEMADEAGERGKDIFEQGREGLEAQLASLRREIATISSAVQDLGEAGWEGAGEVADAVGRQGRRAAEAVRDNPLPVVLGLATVALLAALVFRRD
jgi:uncharacterized protein YoxC